MKHNAAIAALAAALVAAPALAYGRDPAADGTMRATDPYAWKANGTEASTLTIVAGGTVTFSYPTATTPNNAHNVQWLGGKKPSCTGVPDQNSSYVASMVGWSGTCTFTEPGTYEFQCSIHAPVNMKGSIVVEKPAASATPTPTATATPSPGDGGGTTPGASPTPTPTPSGGGSGPQADQQRALKVTLAAAQKGKRVRGSVDVTQAGSRLEVTLKAGKRAVGRFVKAKAPSGANAFAVSLDKRGKRLLARRRSLKLTVAVAVTPPGGKKLARTMSVKLRG